MINTNENQLTSIESTGSRNDIEAWTTRDVEDVLHSVCKQAYYSKLTSRQLDVFIHDRRSKYIGLFQCCTQYRKEI